MNEWMYELIDGCNIYGWMNGWMDGDGWVNK